MPLFLAICKYFGRSPTEMLLQRLDTDPSNTPPTDPPPDAPEQKELQSLRKEVQDLRLQLQTLQEQFAEFTSRQ
jgi:hypothetical protein